MDCCLIITLILIILIIFTIYNNYKKIDEKFYSTQVDFAFERNLNSLGYVNTGLVKPAFFGNIVPLEECTNRQFFIYNEINGEKYFLKKENGALKFEHKRPLPSDSGRVPSSVYSFDINTINTFKFTIVNNSNFFGIDLRDISSQTLKDNFIRCFIFKQNSGSKRSGEIKYYIQSYNYGHFLMNKTNKKEGETLSDDIYSMNNREQNLNSFIFRPQELCSGNGRGDENVGSNYAYSEGIETNENIDVSESPTESIRDTSILRNRSSLCPQDYPYAVNESEDIIDSEFGYEYQRVTQRNRCSDLPPITRYYTPQPNAQLLACDDPPCKSFTVPEGKCYVNTPNEFGPPSQTVHIKDPSNMGISNLPKMILDDRTEITEEEIENRKLFNIICACQNGNIGVDGRLQVCIET